MPTDIPSSVYKNAIDLNRYSNSVAKRLVISYNRIILNATKELQAINPAGYRAGELRTIMGSLKTSLDGWATEASKSMKTEVTGLAESQIEFAVLEMMNQIKADIGNILKDPLVSPQFAEAVVSIDPTELNMVALSDDLQQKVGGRRGATFQLGAREGALVTLPNGESLEKSFRGLSIRSAEKFRLEVQDGLLTGEPIDRIVRNLIGRQGGLVFSTKAKSAAQIANAGGGLTRLANHQIMALVRTSVNQVSNVATQQTYKANRNITDNFMFVATLDSRTSLVCAANDGKEFSYDDGPVPPLHFNCRSTTVAVPNWKKLKEVYGIERPDEPAMRASPDGLIPAKEKYGDWLYKQRVTDDKGRTIGPGIAQIEALGRSRAIYFNRLAARKGGPDAAIRKLIREDGSEKTLEDIRKQYKLRAITLKKLEQLKEATKPTISQLQMISGGAKLSSVDVDKVFNLMDEMEGVAGENARKLRRFAEKKQVACIWSTQREGTIVKNRSKMDHVLKNAQMKRSMEIAVRNKQYGSDMYTNVLKNAINVDDSVSGPQSRLSFASRAVKHYFTAQGKGRSRMNGMTFEGANHILIKRKSGMRPITSLKQMREDVKEAIKKAKTGKDLYWSANGEGMFRENSHWLKTYVHEMGHQVHYASGKQTLSSYDWTPSQYGSSNELERFAETFVQYIFAPVELKKASPSAYKWIEDALSASLKEVEQWK